MRSMMMSQEMPSYCFCILATSGFTLVPTMTARTVAPGVNGAANFMPNQVPNSTESVRARQTRPRGARSRILFLMWSVDLRTGSALMEASCYATLWLHNSAVRNFMQLSGCEILHFTKRGDWPVDHGS